MNETLTLAIIGHLVGDYLLQNDWMALNKKKRTWPCLVHCFLWTCAVFTFTDWPLFHWSFPALFIAHFAQDRTEIIRWWMTNANGQKAFAQPPLAPWSLIVVDNVWHIVTIWAVWKFL